MHTLASKYLLVDGFKINVINLLRVLFEFTSANLSRLYKRHQLA